LLQKRFPNITESTVERGIENVVVNTGLQGRWQCIRQIPRVYCDTGHNVGGFEYLSQQLKHQQCKSLRIVIGMVNDKDINGVLSLLPKKAK
jgi:dihydrofolate synthase/folylpolyglutamate synthase